MLEHMESKYYPYLAEVGAKDAKPPTLKVKGKSTPKLTNCDVR